MQRRLSTSRRWRTLRAALRDAQLVLRESWAWPTMFVVTWLIFGLILWRWHRPDGQGRGLAASLYTAFAQMLFQPQPLPEQGWLQLIFFLAPAVGLVLVARG